MTSQEYWRRRAEAREGLAFQRAEQAQKSLSRAYRKAYRDLDADIRQLFNRYGSRNNMTPEEAEKFLSARELEGWANDMRQRIASMTDSPQRQRLQDQMDEALAMRYRISRAEALQQGVDVRLSHLADEAVNISTKALTDVLENSYYRHIFDMQKGMGFSFSFQTLTMATTKEILSRRWSGDNYSGRIWKNADRLAAEVKETLTAGLETGRSYRSMTKDVMEKMSAGNYEAARLIHTEASAMHNAADLATYKTAGIEWVMFVATLSEKTCDECGDLDRTKIAVKDLEQGENLPPIHPWCRCRTVMWIDAAETEAWKRSARDPKTGKNVKVPYSMSFNDWRGKYVDGPKAQ